MSASISEASWQASARRLGWPATWTRHPSNRQQEVGNRHSNGSGDFEEPVPFSEHGSPSFMCSMTLLLFLKQADKGQARACGGSRDVGEVSFASLGGTPSSRGEISLLHNHLHFPTRTQGQIMHRIRLNRLSWHQRKVDALSKRGNEQVSFHQRKVIAETDAWPCPKGNIGVAGERVFSFWGEDVRGKGLWVGEGGRRAGGGG